MSESMVERVARAIVIARGLKPDRLCTEPGSTAMVWELHIPHARAAIEAMREPTKQMVWAAYEEDRTKSAADDSNIDFAANCFRAMIDAALNEKKPAAD